MSLSFCLIAEDLAVTEKFQAGLNAMKAGAYVKAADNFLDAEHLARNVRMKAEAAKEAMMAYRKANLLYKEFTVIERLLNSYPAEVDFGKLVEREYEICEAYYNGHRDYEFWSLRWIPWLLGPDRSEEILEKALKHAPFAQTAPRAKLRLAVLQLENGKVKEALKQLRELVKNYPQSKYCKFAYLELGNALFQLSMTGDGDGKYNGEAVNVFEKFIKTYPNAAEIDWVKKCLLRSKDIQAKRLLGIAKFYKRIGRTAPAERYLNDILIKYPDTKSAEDSEEILAKIDKSYTPEGFRPTLESRYQKYDVIPIPAQTSRIIMVPENSNGKYLFPLRDLGIKRRDSKAENENE
ncbi:MAG: outer membrane protein assembly factor BamD [Victivallaceae bacterium]|nr:outer membrane protein assembly factor BamD [Victivallaceae bacterium]